MGSLIELKNGKKRPKNIYLYEKARVKKEFFSIKASNFMLFFVTDHFNVAKYFYTKKMFFHCPRIVCNFLILFN